MHLFPFSLKYVIHVHMEDDLFILMILTRRKERDGIEYSRV